MASRIKIATNLQRPSSKENEKIKSKALVEAMDGRKTSNVKDTGFKTTNNTKKESNAKLALSRCSRGITKRKALGNIGNNVIIKTNRNDDNKCDKKLDTKVNLRKKIEASKVLIGLKAKKSQTHTIKPIIDLPVTAIDNKKDAEIGRIIPPVKNDQNKEILFSLPEGVDNIDTEW